METIGRGTWIDKLAREMLRREQELGRSTGMLHVESGLGASGIPHIGSIGDAARAYAVSLALRDMGHDSKLIAYSDDMDGLRKVPHGLPKSLEEHLARPVSMIPDVDGCHSSYGEHMSGMLLEGLDMCGIRYEFRRAYDTYRNGLLADQIDTILSNAKRIGRRISEMVGQEKYNSILPYYPVCAECGRLYTCRARSYDSDRRAIQYDCADVAIGGQNISGCGHAGESHIARDMGKLAWKVEFAARWAAFDVRFEAYGKDIMDSVQINDWVADRVLGFAHPHHARYEMFLDRGGKKISKSAGNVLTAQRWLRYGTPQSLLLLLYKRISGAREVGPEDIPTLMDEYNELEGIYFGQIKLENEEKLSRLRGLYEYVNLLEPPKGPASHTRYGLAIEMSKAIPRDRADLVVKRLAEYCGAEPDQPMRELARLAGNYADDVGGAAPIQRYPIGQDEAAALEKIADMLEDNIDIKNAVRDAAGELPVRGLYRTLYRVILGTDGGPRLGPLIDEMGVREVAGMIREGAKGGA